MNAFSSLMRGLNAPGPWQSLAIDVVLKTTLLLLIAALASAILRHRSAAARHLVWASAMGSALVVPVLSLALPSWRIPVLPGAVAGSAGPDLADASGPTPTPTPPIIPATSFAGVPGPIPPEGIARREPPAPIASAIPSARPIPTGPGRTTDTRPPGSWGPWIVAAWGIGAVVVITPLLVASVGLRWLGRRSARLVEGPEPELVGEIRAQLRLGRPVAILRGDDRATPMTWGVFRPVVLLPGGSGGWTKDRLRAVLLHELAHVARWDCLTLWASRIACALYWFHPLAWLASSRLKVERERACDDLVLRSGARPSDYAGHLLAVATALRPSPVRSSAAVAMARPSGLEGRLLAILDASRSRRDVGRRGACLVLATVAALLVPLSAARLGARVAPEQEPAAAPSDADRPDSMTVSGRVLDPDGRPLPGADVAIIGRRKIPMMSAYAEPQQELLGRTRSDAEGRFRIDVRRTSSVTHYELHALAGSPGLGLGWAELNRDAESPTAEISLRPEQVVEARIVDLQGVPAEGVEVRIDTIGVRRPEVGSFDGFNFWRQTPEGLDGLWPAPVTTNAEGLVRLRGIRGAMLSLRVDDPRYARQSLRIPPEDVPEEAPVTLILDPALVVEGRVTDASTGEPIPGALLVVGSASNRWNIVGDHYHTDAEGRYRASPAPGDFVSVKVYPPRGAPSLIFEKVFEANAGEARIDLDMAVPRGVLITGRIAERGTGRPIEGGSVYYMDGRTNVVDGEGTIPGWMAAVPIDADGRYAIAVTPGKGHLVFYGPTSDFVHEMKGSRGLYGRGDMPGGNRYRAHAFVPYEVEEGQEPLEIDAELIPGVTVVGRVEGPGGRSVVEAEIITTLSISPFHGSWRGDFTIPVRDGRFELHGVPPDQAVKCSFLDAENGLGATIEVSGAMADDGPLTVTLEPCGEATARLVDGQGRPVAESGLSLHFVATPGPGMDFGTGSLTDEERSQLAADEEIYANVDRRNYWEGPRSDADGRITLPKLIPGATYRIYEPAPDRGEGAQRWRDFTVEAGQALDLGDVRVRTNLD